MTFQVGDKIGKAVVVAVAGCKLPPVQAGQPKRQRTKRGDGYKSAAESRYAEFLFRCPLVDRWWYEPLTFTLAPKTTYTPDFLVVLTAGVVCLVEVKGGYTWEDSAVKFKLARQLRPEFRWLCVECRKGQWRIKFKSGNEPLELVP